MIGQIVAIDFSHLFHVCWHAAQKAPPHYDPIETTIENVVGKLRTVKAALRKENIVGYDLIFAEDRPALRKLALLPGYRAGRVDLTAEKEQIKTYLLQNGSITRFCHSPDNEADDVLASLVKVANENGLHSIICTGDRDLWQLIDPKVKVFNPIKQEMVTEAHIERAFRCRPIHIPLFKSLWGDSGDCVPNVVPRMQKQLLPIILKTDGTLEAFFGRIENGDKYFLSEKCFNLLEENKTQIEINYQVVKLDNQCELIWE